jgi:hypothetical protein
MKETGTKYVGAGRREMSNLDTIPCYVCHNEIDIDDSVWADSKGNISNPLYCYCVSCLPGQKESY